MNLQFDLINKLSEGLKEGAEKLIVPDVVDWIEKEFHIPETKNDPKLRGRIKLMQYQRDVLREIFSKDENGDFKYSIIIWSDIKKSAKSSIAAAVNVYRAYHMEFGEFYVVANDLKQADSRVAHYIRRAIQLNPKLRDKFKINGYRITSPTGSFIEAIPIDPSGEAGGNADGITWSELWGSNETAKQNMWCLDDETEALTRTGFKKGTELTTDDEIATYKDGKVHWEHPKSIFCEDYAGKLHTYEHKNFSLRCTPDHRLCGRYSPEGSKWNKFDVTGVLRSNELRYMPFNYYHPILTVDEVERSKDVPEFVHIKGTKFKKEKDIPMKNWAAFLGVYLSEGSTSDFRGVPCKVRISQLRAPHPERYDKIYEILKECFGDWVLVNKGARKDGFSIASTEVAKITKPLGTTWFKRVPRYIIEGSKEVLQAFLDGYILGDGSNPCSGGGINIPAATHGMADDLQEIAFRLGIRSSVKPSPLYWRTYLIKEGNPTVSIARKHWKEIDYSGKVWCPSISTGLFIARRKGWIFVTGNTEQTLPPAKFGRSFRWIESYAGFSEESDLLYGLYDLGVKQGRLLWPDKLYEVTEGEPTPLELYVNDEAHMLCLWNTIPRCPWQTKRYYATEEQILPPNQFQRIHRNQWVTSSETFVPIPWIMACGRTQEEWPVIDFNRHPVIIAMDAATSNDDFALFMGCRHPTKTDEILTIYAKKWTPKKNTGKIDFMGTEDDPGPELVLRDLIKKYNVIQVCYDPYQLFSTASRLKQEGLAWFKSFNQGTDRLIADSGLRDLIRDRRFWHRNEEDLIEHFKNANAKLDEQDSKIRIVKRADRLKIDLTVAASMCSHELLRLNL
jgi:phage terminase large subunit-like protein